MAAAPQGAPQGPQPNLQFVPAGPLGTPVTICEFLGKRYQVLARIGNEPAAIDAAARAQLEQLIHTLCALHEAQINSAPPATPFRIDQMTAAGMHDKDGTTIRAHNFVIGNAIPQMQQTARHKQEIVTQCLTDEGIDVAAQGNNVEAVELWNRIAGHCAVPVAFTPITNAQAAPLPQQPQPAQQRPVAQTQAVPQPAVLAQEMRQGGAEHRTPGRSAQRETTQPQAAAVPPGRSARRARILSEDSDAEMPVRSPCAQRPGVRRYAPPSPINAQAPRARPIVAQQQARPVPAPTARPSGLAAEAERARVRAQRFEEAHEVLRGHYNYRRRMKADALRKEMQAKAAALPGFNQKSFDGSCGQAMKGNDTDAMAVAFEAYLKNYSR